MIQVTDLLPGNATNHTWLIPVILNIDRAHAEKAGGVLGHRTPLRRR